MEKLVLSNSKFSDDILYDFSKLKVLRINDWMNFTEIPDGFFKNSWELADLDIRETKLIKIQKNDFLSLSKLNDLKLVLNTELEEIESGAFDSLTSLIKLKIVISNLKTLPEDIFKNLENLDLNYNKFNNLPDKWFSGKKKTETLWFLFE